MTPVEVTDGGGYKAIYEALALSVKGFGASPLEAIAAPQGVAEDLLADEAISALPEPRVEAPWTDNGGRVTLRLPKILHAQLDRLAVEQGIGLNRLMSHALQSAATSLMVGQEFGPCSRRVSPGLPEIRAA